MEANNLTLLAIDLNRDDLAIVKAVVRDALPGCALLIALNGPQGIELARTEDPDLILLDIAMPGMDGGEVCRRLKADDLLRSIPVIFLTAPLTDRPSRVKALAAGAEGFLSKPLDEQELVAQARAMAKLKAAGRAQQLESAQLAAVVTGHTRELEDELTERKQAEEAMRQGLAKVEASRRTLLSVVEDQKRSEEAMRKSEAKYRAILDGSADGILIADLETKRFNYANRAVCRMLGYDADALRTMSVPDIVQKDAVQSSLADFEAQNRGEKALAVGVQLVRKDGSVVYVDISSTTLTVDDRPCGVGFFRDTTERKRAEQDKERMQAQLNQAQKMESVGRLAGGVAHDINNMLSVILGNAELAVDGVAPGDPLHAYLEEILDAARRSTDITRQLLAFARKQTISPKVLDLNETLEGMLKMLRRLIGEDIDPTWLPGARLWPVKMDPSQLDQILANLCVNARDAISGIGKITIETNDATFDDAYCADHAGSAPGEFVLLAVSDNGCGMDKETLDHVFDPFFTTKDVSQGTGLGLAMVYGIVKQNNGFISAYSEPGKGTTFRIFLPRHPGEHERIGEGSPAEIASGHGEMVLVVEDESAIMKMGKRMLEELGYQVLAANGPSEALRLAGEHAGGIHLLITDVVMPEMNGRDLANRMQALYPGIKTLFMSGYTANLIAHRGVLDDGVNFIEKPFSKRDLASKVRGVLDQK